MVDDLLSGVLDLVEVRGSVTGGFVVDGAWTTHTPVLTPMKLIAVAAGGARVRTGSHDAVSGADQEATLGAGDVAVLIDRAWVTVSGGAGSPVQHIDPEPGLGFAARRQSPESTVVVGGHAELNPAGRELLLQTLPALGLVRATERSAGQLHGLLQRLLVEAASAEPGSNFAARQYAHLVVLEAVRGLVMQTDLPPGWLRVLADEPLHPALKLLHRSPGKPWRLQELATAASMSRTTFAKRFRDLAGIPAGTYLTRWRMLLAQRALRETDQQVGSLARELGYNSEAAFSTAFKRETGESPLAHRRRLRHPHSPPKPLNAVTPRPRVS